MLQGAHEFRASDRMIGEAGQEVKVPPKILCANFGNMYGIGVTVSYDDLKSGAVDTSFFTLVSCSRAMDDFHEMGWSTDGHMQIRWQCVTIPLNAKECCLVYLVRSRANTTEISPQGLAAMASFVANSRSEPEATANTDAPEAIGKATLNDANVPYLFAALLRLPKGIYNESLQDRGEVLDALYAEVVPGLMSSSLGKDIQRLKNGEIVALVMDGLPVDPSLSDTPMDGKAPVNKRTFVSEGLALGIARILGYPSAILNEQHENLVHQIAPIPSEANSQSNAGAVALLDHQDMAPQLTMPDVKYDAFMPDYLVLGGVRENLETPTLTYLSAVRDVIALLDAETVEILAQERFVTDPPDSFKREGVGADNVPKHAVINVFQGRYETAFDSSSKVRAYDENDKEAVRALDKFRDAVLKVRRGIEIRPGTAVAFRNREVIHGRGPVNADFEGGERRWLQRVYAYDFDRVLRMTGTLRSDVRRMVVNAAPGFLSVLPAVPDIAKRAEVPERIARLDG